MNQEPDKRSNEEDLEELREVIKKIEELQKQKEQKPKPPKGPFIALEFGGVFHHNRFINFIFGYILNFTFAYFVIELFDFAEYNDIIYVAALMFVYSALEEIFKTYVLIKHFPLIIRSFGTIFFFGYLLIFYILDQYVFIQQFNFINATLLTFFVLIFTIARYVFGTTIRRYFRRHNMR